MPPAEGDTARQAPHAWLTPLRRPLPAYLLVSFWLINLVFLVVFADRDGYEGDDLNTIVPMFHLTAAKHGALVIYNYAWQPLTYEIGAAVLKLAGTPTAIFLLAPVAGSVSLLLLLSLLWRDRQSIRDLVICLIVLLAIPEFWFTSLYFNPTVLGLPFALGALAILVSRPRAAMAFLAGVLAALAILTRFEFALIGPALVLTAWLPDRSLARPATFVLGVVSIFAVAFLAGVFDPLDTYHTYKVAADEISAKANVGGWDMRVKLFVITVIFSPVGWALFIIGGPFALYRALRRDVVKTGLWAAALVPAALPMLNLLSPKYFIPLGIFALFFLKDCLLAIESLFGEKRKMWPVRVAAAGSVALLFISFSLMGKPPFITVGTLASRPVKTHDGTRSYGGYLWHAAAMDRFTERSEEQLEARAIQQRFSGPNGPDIVIVGEEYVASRGGVGWRHLQLELERAGVHGRLAAPHRLQFEQNGRMLTLVRELPADLRQQLDRGRGLEVIDLR